MGLATLLRSGRVYLPVDDETGASWGAQYHGLSLANGQAFIRVEGVNLANYASAENLHKIVISDSASVITKGYIDVADAAEALGSELVTNGDNEAAKATFDEDSDILGSSTQDNGQAHSGTYSTKFTLNGTNYYGYRKFRDSDLSIVTSGKLYKISVWVYLPSGQTIDRIKLQVYGQATNPAIVNTYTTDTWVELTVKVTVDTDITIYILGEDSQSVDNSDYFYFDDLSIKEVTDVGTDGVHIMSAKNGTTRNWESIGSGFDYNDSSYTFDVLRYR